MSGKTEKALTDVEEALKLYPTYVKALRTKARIQLNSENYEESVSNFKEALNHCTIEEKSGLEREVREAEKELKKSKRVNHYKILGVEKDADQTVLKKAFRKQSLVHHPDKGGNDETFKQINESYSVLSDPQQRRRYDMGADIEDDMFAGGASPFANAGFGGGVDLSDILFGMGAGGMGGGMGGMPNGGFRFSTSSGGGFPF